MKKNKKYIFVIIVLILVIICEPFISLKIGNKVVLSLQKYETIKNVYDKYARQEKVLRKIKSQFLYKPNESKIKQESLRGAINGFDDPYTVYMDPDEYKEFLSTINGSFVGIGVVLVFDNDKNVLKIEKVYPNSPALEAGLKKGDYIMEVCGESASINVNNPQIIANEIEKIKNKISGEEGTKVNICVSRDEKRLSFDITRRHIDIPIMSSKKINDIGIIKLLNFDMMSGVHFELALNDLLNQNTKKLILDLRDNPGGLLDEATEISNLFLAKNSMITYTKDNKNKKQEVRTKSGQIVFDLPIAILVNRNSASATELFAAMMQDYGLATIIGETTYGKGLVQIMQPFKDGSAVKVTVSEYFTPSGKKINNIGVIPDIDLSNKMKESNFQVFDTLENLSAEDILNDVCFKKAFEVLDD